MTSQDLKPCPFCGDAPYMNSSGSFDGWSATVNCLNKQCRVRPSLTTNVYRSYTKAEQAALKLWNNRQPQPNNILEKARIISFPIKDDGQEIISKLSETIAYAEQLEETIKELHKALNIAGFDYNKRLNENGGKVDD